MEECGEVIQMASKCQRFGIDSQDNLARLKSEIWDVLAAIEQVEDESDSEIIGHLIMDHPDYMMAVIDKKERVNKYWKLHAKANN